MTLSASHVRKSGGQGGRGKDETLSGLEGAVEMALEFEGVACMVWALEGGTLDTLKGLFADR